MHFTLDMSNALVVVLATEDWVKKHLSRERDGKRSGREKEKPNGLQTVLGDSRGSSGFN